MSARISVNMPKYIRLINQAIRQHKKYRKGMMVELVPYDVRPEGFSVVCKIPDVFEVVSSAVEKVNQKYCS
jgi:hypothetical protein